MEASLSEPNRGGSLNQGQRVQVRKFRHYRPSSWGKDGRDEEGPRRSGAMLRPLCPRMSLVQGAKRLSGTETVSVLISSGLLERASQRSVPCLSIVVKRDLRCLPLTAPWGACSTSLLLGRGRTVGNPQT